MTYENKTAVSEAAVGRGHGDSHIDWPAIFSGAFIAVAMSMLLLMFGAAIGLSFASPWAGRGADASTLSLGSAIWFALVNIFSIGMGAYFAGRLRPRVEPVDRNEVQFRDGANGVVVWAITLIVGTLLAIQLVSMTVSTAVSVATSGSQMAGQMMAGAAGNRMVQDATTQLFRRATAAAKTDAGTGNTAGQGGARSLPSPEERRRIMEILQSALVSGELSADDRSYLAEQMTSATGLTPEQAAERLNTVVANATKAAKAAADEARETAAMIGFWTAFIMLLAGIFAWWAGTLGGNHRDKID